MSNTMTPYKAAKEVNAQLAEMGIERTLPPQMLYTYVNKGYIESVEVDGKKRVTAEALAKWFVGYVTKTTKKAAEPTSSVWNFGDLVADEDPEEDLAIEAEFDTDDES